MNNNEFKPLPFWKEIFLKKEELQEYYILKREYLYNKNISLLKNLKIKEILHPILLKLMSFNRKYIDKQTLTIINDKSTKTDKPVIYAITHLGMYDYQLVSEAIRKHQIPFAGDPETMYRTLDGMLLELNGVIWCDTEQKIDRKIAKDTSIELLEKGHNLLIYPEGIWNLSPNLLALPLFPGIIEMAKATGVEIVPIAIEQYEKDFYVNIGENIKINEDANIDEERENLRNAMATLKWEIMEQQPVVQRSALEEYAKENRKFVDRRLFEWFDKANNRPFYDDKTLMQRRFREKGISVPTDAFAYFKSIKLNKNNAFMFRKDSSLPEETQEIIEEKIR